MIGALLFYGAVLAWDFYVNVWQSALILVGIFLVAVVLNFVAVWVVFGAMRDIERYLAKRNSIEAPGVFQGFSHTALNRFGALLTAVVDVVYAGIVFTHYHGLAPQSVAIFFAACAWGLLSRHMTSRVDGTGPQSWLGFCGAMLVYAIGFAYLNPTPTRPATIPAPVAAPAETGHGEGVTPAEPMPPSGTSADADQLRLC